MADIEIKDDALKSLESQLVIQNKLTEKKRKEKELEQALEEANKARKMVEEKMCNPPKKNSRLLQKINATQNEFVEPLPLKRIKIDDDAPQEPPTVRNILAEKQNTMSLGLDAPSVEILKEFSFG